MSGSSISCNFRISTLQCDEMPQEASRIPTIFLGGGDIALEGVACREMTWVRIRFTNKDPQPMARAVEGFSFTVLGPAT
jgi:hypothetical protein